MRCLPGVAALSALMIVLSLGGCDEEKTADGADYSACEGTVLNNQILVCDSVMRAVEGLCEFNLTIEPCDCAAEAEDCTEETGWLEGVIACEDEGSCADYMDCLEALGDSPEGGCDTVTEWECLTTAA